MLRHIPPPLQNGIVQVVFEAHFLDFAAWCPRHARLGAGHPMTAAPAVVTASPLFSHSYSAPHSTHICGARKGAGNKCAGDRLRYRAPSPWRVVNAVTPGLEAS